VITSKHKFTEQETAAILKCHQTAYEAHDGERHKAENAVRAAAEIYASVLKTAPADSTAAQEALHQLDMRLSEVDDCLTLVAMETCEAVYHLSRRDGLRLGIKVATMLSLNPQTTAGGIPGETLARLMAVALVDDGHADQLLEALLSESHT